MQTTTVASAAATTPEVAPTWPLERLLFLLAGTITILSVALGALVSPWFLLLTAFVGINELVFSATGHCGASLILERLFGVERGCPR